MNAARLLGLTALSLLISPPVFAAEAPDAKPSTVSEAMIKKIIANDWPLVRFADPKRGFIFIEYVDSDTDASGESKRAERLCGKKLIAGLNDLYQQIKLRGDTRIACENSATSHSCTLGGGHDEPTLHVSFAPDKDRGLVLDSVMSLQEATMLARWRKKVDAYVKSELARLQGGSCTP